MWYDAPVEAVMARTSARPVPAGNLTAHEALAFGLVLAVASVAVFGLDESAEGRETGAAPHGAAKTMSRVKKV